MERDVSRKILFVCLGNICRSPAAEAIFNYLSEREGLVDLIASESAGTANYHVGEPPDPRMRAAGEARGYRFVTLARQFDPERDFHEFDYILTMDPSNLANVTALDRRGEWRHKVRPMVSYCRRFQDSQIPDPYYGGEENFRYVLDLLEDACAQLLDELKQEIKG